MDELNNLFSITLNKMEAGLDDLRKKSEASKITNMFKLIKDELSNECYDETMETSYKIIKHDKLSKFTLLYVELTESDTITFSFSISKPDRNGRYDPWIMLHLQFNDPTLSGKTSYMVQIFNRFDLCKNMYSAVIYETLEEALDRCASELEKRENIIKNIVL